MPDLISVEEPVAELRSISVTIFDDNGDPVTGIDESDVTIKIKKPGGSYTASSATLVEDTGSADGGTYDLVFPPEEVDTLGDLKFEISSGTTTIETVRGYVTVIQSLDASDAGVSSAVLHSGIAQSGGANTITLDSSASNVNNIYARALVAIVGGTGAGQTRWIIGYAGATKVATVERAWAVTPDATSEFQILAADQPPGFDSEMEAGITYGDAQRLNTRTLNAKMAKVGADYVYRDLADTKDSHTGTVTGSGRVDATIIDPT